ncbi:MAG TPA: 4'-phosphopantetheinyl transferase superfamily protein [Candidatus Mediterraneibacter faecavium]|uniref:4'-phosphopantetheinyl transferase superfamily protein n=1 Tax=Candidatus Mediterraneibacter faecavium TaxID=2838668 RepID=A0A9D2QB63_9FIRM|nr:4'-phosphopantetheinyl transferase superfamily protein [Candidatus Mediterraneibacter faecavium]
MVRAWIADVTPLLDKGCYDSYYRQAPDFRKKKADALRLDKMRAQSIGVWALWQKIRTAYELPEEPVFNFSHSGTCVMCAVCMDGRSVEGRKVRVGCDVEKIGQLKMNIAMRYFCKEEYGSIKEAGSDEEKTDLFFRYWVLKESFMKATGKGMALPANSFCIRMGDPPVLVRQPAEFPESYYYREYRVSGSPYKMAVCSTDADIDTELHTELTL